LQTFGTKTPCFQFANDSLKPSDLENLSGSRCVDRLHQKIHVGHRPLTGAIEAHGVQRRALQTNNRDPLLAGARVDLIQQFLDPAMTGSHVRLLACQEVSPLRRSLPAQRPRQQGRYTVNHGNGAGEPPLDRGPVGCDQGGLGKLGRQPFRDFAQGPPEVIGPLRPERLSRLDNLSSKGPGAAKKGSMVSTAAWTFGWRAAQESATRVRPRRNSYDQK
jgi:hypothetical protein